MHTTAKNVIPTIFSNSGAPGTSGKLIFASKENDKEIGG